MVIYEERDRQAVSEGKRGDQLREVAMTRYRALASSKRELRRLKCAISVESASDVGSTMLSLIRLR